MTAFLSSVACVSLALAASVGAQTSTTVLEAVSQPPEVDRTDQTHDVDFKADRYDRMTVEVRLGGSGPYRFLVDTGTDRTAVSRELAGRLKLTPGRGALMHSISGASRVQTAALKRLEFSTKVVRDVDAPLLDAAKMGADGILGVDSLRSQRLLFDFKAQTMSIVPAAQPVIKERDTIVVTGRLKNGRLLMTDASADGLTVTVVIDTGSEVTVGNQALRRRLAARGKLRSLGPVNLQSVTGQTIVGEYMVLKELGIGGLGLKDLAIVFADAHTFDRLNLNKKPALLLGMNAIRAFDKVSIDFVSKKMRVVLPAHSGLADAVLAAR